MKDIDQIDLRILEYLLNNGRERVTKIADDLNINRVTAAERIEKLEEKGIIEKFTVKINYEMLGINVLAFVFISYEKSPEMTQRSLAEKVAEIEGVEEVHLIAGEFDILAKVRAKTLRELGEKVINKIRSFPGVEGTYSHVVFETVKD